ncbi:PAS domain-containing protein [Qipengyuania atrilutea]|nr:PAS domain-containing protein [Actirhodobacter atriluteus]
MSFKSDEDHIGNTGEVQMDKSQARSMPSFDDSPDRFRSTHPDDRFSGASGVLFEQAMAQTRMAICLSDPHAEDLPIVFANRAFRQLTGYSEEEIIGNNCRFLQGPRTSQEPLEKIRRAIEEEDVVVVEVLNYRKDGTPFWNALHLGPIYDADGRLVYFFGSQWDVSDVRAAREEERIARVMARELSHRMKNMFSVISGIVNITGRTRGIRSEAAEINSRIQALGRAYETTLDDAAEGDIDMGDAIRAILSPYDDGDGRLNLRGDGTRAPFAGISVVGLLLHELAANATKHGAWSQEGGTVSVVWGSSADGNELQIDWLEQGGPPFEAAKIQDGTGTAIMERLVAGGGGSIEREWTDGGLLAKLRIGV